MTRVKSVLLLVSMAFVLFPLTGPLASAPKPTDPDLPQSESDTFYYNDSIIQIGEYDRLCDNTVYQWGSTSSNFYRLQRNCESTLVVMTQCTYRGVDYSEVDCPLF